jgi:hypothetical protein
MHASRTRWLFDSISKIPQFIRLKKFAAMGSALTFPVQSLFFLSCALAACGASNKKEALELRGKVRVFGDDIIVPERAYATLVSLLSHLGLKVNEKKSFSTGLFRESCGGDYWFGHDVTPVKPKTLTCDTPEDFRALIDTSNNFFRKGLWLAAKCIESTAERYTSRLPIRAPSSGVFGLLSFCGTSIGHLKRRFNSKLQREEAFVFDLITKVKVHPEGNWPALLQWYTEKPSHFLPKWTAGRTDNRSSSIGRRWVAVEELC